MTADVINLRRVRKARRRVEKGEEAAANRALHGRGKAERDLHVYAAARAARTLDNHRRDEPQTPIGADDTGA